jgi:hypothetical protein
MGNSINPSNSFLGKSKKWIIRFIKFNLVGIVVFLVGTAIYSVAFSTFGFWTWLVANGTGSVLQFGLIEVVNRTRRGRIFDSCEEPRQEAKQQSNPTVATS